VLDARRKDKKYINNKILQFSANNDLMQFFGKCRDGKIRVFKVAIENGNFCVNLNFTIHINQS
jgi:hypothetical protein